MERVLLGMKELQIIDHQVLINFSDELLRIWNIIWSDYTLPTTDPNSTETKMVWYVITQTLVLIKEYYYSGQSELGLTIETSFPFKIIKKFHDLSTTEQILFKCWCESFSAWTKVDPSASTDALYPIKSLILSTNVHEWSDLGKRVSLVPLLYYVEGLFHGIEANTVKIAMNEDMKVTIMAWTRHPKLFNNLNSKHLAIYISSDWMAPIVKLMADGTDVKIEVLKSLVENRLFKVAGSYRERLLEQYAKAFPFLGLKTETDQSSNQNAVNIKYNLNLPLSNANFSSIFLAKRYSRFFSDTEAVLKECYDNNKRYWEAWAKLFDSEVVNPHCLLDNEDIYNYPFGEILGIIHENKACLFTRKDLIWITTSRNNPWTKVDFDADHLKQIELHLKLTSTCRETTTLADIFKKFKLTDVVK